MPSVQIVANELARAPGWRKAFRVVSAVYSAETSVVLLASEAGTKITLDAKVDALRALEVGNAQASISVSASSERSFRSIGKAGVLDSRCSISAGSEDPTCCTSILYESRGPWSK